MIPYSLVYGIIKMLPPSLIPLTAKAFTKLLSESDNKPILNAKPSFDI